MAKSTTDFLAARDAEFVFYDNLDKDSLEIKDLGGRNSFKGWYMIYGIKRGYRYGDAACHQIHLIRLTLKQTEQKYILARETEIIYEVGREITETDLVLFDWLILTASQSVLGCFRPSCKIFA